MDSPLRLQLETLNLEAQADDDFKATFSGLTKLKKKSKKPTGEAPDELNVQPVEESNASADATYMKLLNRIFTTLRAQNPDLSGERKKFSMVPPSIHREGTKKTLFANFYEICTRMNRDMEHLTQFLFCELGTTGSTDSSNRLIIKGRFQQKQIENVLKRYIVEYVTCKTCKSGNTTLKRENRLHFQHCEACGSVRSVSAIKSGFKAQTEKRAAIRNKEA